MTDYPLQSQDWPEDRGILLVHGVGNATPGSYDTLVEQLKGILGSDASRTAIYFLYYDQINQWFEGHTQASALVASFFSILHAKAAGEKVADAAADFAGDVVWPILVADARLAVRTAYLAQLQQIVRDGKKTNGSARNLRLSIICHSLGCFHTYEAIHEAASREGQGLSPVDGVKFENVIYMAPPVQLIRSVARDLGSAVPDRGSLHCLNDTALCIPSAQIGGEPVVSVKRWVSITGDLDPVGGFFFRHRANWAYMNVENQVSFIDEQQALKNINSEEDLESVLRASLREKSPPLIEPQNPHDWSAYVTRHSGDLKQWLA
jgi:hypothetical protein